MNADKKSRTTEPTARMRRALRSIENAQAANQQSRSEIEEARRIIDAIAIENDQDRKLSRRKSLTQ